MIEELACGQGRILDKLLMKSSRTGDANWSPLFAPFYGPVEIQLNCSLCGFGGSLFKNLIATVCMLEASGRRLGTVLPLLPMGS